jgi:hypothetical protein
MFFNQKTLKSNMTKLVMTWSKYASFTPGGTSLSVRLKISCMCTADQVETSADFFQRREADRTED